MNAFTRELNQTATVDHTTPDGVRTLVDYPCLLQQAGAKENAGLGAAQLTSTWRLFLPPEAVIGGHSLVTVAGRRFSVEGEPDVLRDHHIEAALAGTDGP